MTTVQAELTPPVLLLAMPQVVDPFFHRAVVLLLHHDDEGSFGFIINRTTGIHIAEILEGMEIPWGGSDAAVSHFGGPVQPQIGTVLFTPTPAMETEETTEIIPGLAMTQHVDRLSELAAEPPAHFRLLLGYAGWGGGQLVEEILRNDWILAPATEELICSTPDDQQWEASLQSVGIDPGSLPSWTDDDNEPEAN